MASYPEMDSGQPFLVWLLIQKWTVSVSTFSDTRQKNLMADEISSSSASATLSTATQTFRSELRSGFDREDFNENSSFISYLKFALDSILKQEPLQSALNIIEEELTGHVNRKATGNN
jgi:hypothetical protein